MSGATIGGVVGGVIGLFFGAPQIGFAIGSMVGGALDPVHMDGPRLGDIPVQTSQEGVFRPIVYGAPQPFPGNIIQTGPKIFSIVEDKQGKGSGPTSDHEEVHQTYAIRICEGPAVCIKIFRDGKLVYDRSGTAVFDADSSVFSSKVTLYEGDEDQLPDPALEALPAAHGGGVGNVPAYRGTAYMVIANDNLTGTGGRIPNYEFLMASSAVISADCIEEGLVAWWPLDDAASGGVAAEIVGGKNAEYTAGVSGSGPLNYGSSGSMLVEDATELAFRYGTSGELAVASYPGWTLTAWCAPAELLPANAVVAINYNNDFDGTRAWGLHIDEQMRPIGGWGGGSFSETIVIGDPISTGRSSFLVLVYDNLTLKLYQDALLVDSISVSGNSSFSGSYVQFGGGGGGGGFVGSISDVKLYNYALSEADIFDRYVSTSEPFYELPDAPGSWVSPDGITHTFCAERATPDTVYLSDIELDIANRAGLTDAQMDVSEITAIEVEGLLIGKQMSCGGALNTCGTAYFHDAPEHGLQIHARRRGSASVVTLTDNDFVDSGDDEIVRAQAIELPRKLNLYFSDPDANHAVVPVSAERVSTNVKATGIASVQLPLVLNRDSAKQKAEVMQKVMYEESQGRLTRELPAFKHANLVPSDAFTYASKRWRINTIEQLDATIKIDAVRDRISNYSSQATAGSVVNPSDPISNVRGPSVLYPMNLPRLRTQDNVPGVYLAVTGLLDAWPGSHIYMSSDGGATEQLMTTITSRAILGELDADIDTGVGTITVWAFDNRDLESITEADLALRRNAFALIDAADVAEIGQFETATETATPNHWDLTELHRPLLDTTLADHDAGERFVMLDGAIRFLPLSASLIGRTLIFRAVTIGTAAANNPTVSMAFVPLFTGPEEIEYMLEESGGQMLEESGGYMQEE